MTLLPKHISVKIFFFCFFGILALNLNAQETIRGHVLDSLTREPLSGATVFFNQTSIWTVTDKNGYFELYMENLP